MKNTEPIKQNYEFRRVYSRGRSVATARIVLYFRKNGRPENRLGITVSTKLGKAVTRNKVKRRFREIYRLREERLCRGFDIVMVARGKSAVASYRELERDFDYLAGKLGLMRKE